MAPTIYGGPQYANRSWSKNTVTLRFDETGLAEVAAGDVDKLDLQLHQEFTLKKPAPATKAAVDAPAKKPAKKKPAAKKAPAKAGS
jgi:hypothetical protein